MLAERKSISGRDDSVSPKRSTTGSTDAGLAPVLTSYRAIRGMRGRSFQVRTGGRVPLRKDSLLGRYDSIARNPWGGAIKLGARGLCDTTRRRPSSMAQNPSRKTSATARVDPDRKSCWPGIHHSSAFLKASPRRSRPLISLPKIATLATTPRVTNPPMKTLGTSPR